MLMATSVHRMASEHWGTASKERSRRWCSGVRLRQTELPYHRSIRIPRRCRKKVPHRGRRCAGLHRRAAPEDEIPWAALERSTTPRRGEEADGGAGGSPWPWGSAGRRTRWRRSVQCGILNTSAAWRASLVVQADEGAVGGAWVAGRCSDRRQPGGFSAGAGSHGGKAGRRDARKGGGGRGEGGEIWWLVWHGERRR